MLAQCLVHVFNINATKEDKFKIVKANVYWEDMKSLQNDYTPFYTRISTRIQAGEISDSKINICFYDADFEADNPLGSYFQLVKMNFDVSAVQIGIERKR